LLLLEAVVAVEELVLLEQMVAVALAAIALPQEHPVAVHLLKLL
jgi:hypothetical protein